MRNQCTATFEDGPLDGRKRAVEWPLKEYLYVHVAGDVMIFGEEAKPYPIQVAVYVLWDNWPARYLFQGFKKGA